MTGTPTAIARPRKGRPTREEAQARQDALLECAIDHFLERGYERATLEAIAADVSMTKRTVYAKYDDKAALFVAAVTRAIEKFAIDEAAIEATRGTDLAETLRNIAMLRIDLVATREGLRLQRIIQTESYRFPAIFTDYYRLATRPTVRFLERVLREECETGTLALPDAAQAASVFMSMAVSGPVRFITSGNPLSRAEIDDHVAFSVRLFLDGARTRSEGET